MLPKIFQKFKNLVCATSKRKNGDLKTDLKKREAFLKKFKIEPCNLVTLKQIHSNKVYIVNDTFPRTLYGDGLITPKKKICLGIFTADCLPIFIFDPKKEIIGLLHAGWRGTLKKISKKAILIFKKLGSLPKDILVYIGPSICGNCYLVDEERVKIFSLKFSSFKNKIFKKKNNRYFLDLRLLNKLILIKEGVPHFNIQVSKICTFSNKNYFSFKREGKKLSGEMLSIFCQQGIK